MPAPRSKVLTAIAAFVAGVAFIGLLVILAQGLGKPYSPPDLVRPWAEEAWETATEDRSALPRLAPFRADDYFDSFRITEEPMAIEIVIPDAASWQYRPNYEHHDARTSPMSTFASLATLHAVGTLTPSVPPSDGSASPDDHQFARTNVVFVDPSGTPLGEVEWTEWFRHRYSPNYHPRVYLRFDHPTQPEFQIDRIRFFDRLTHVELSASGMTAQPTPYDGFTVAYADHLSWRRNQTLAAIEASVGPEHAIVLDPIEGAEQAGGGQVLRLLRVFPGFEFGGSTSMQTTDTETIADYRREGKGPPPADHPHTGFLVAAYPYGGWSSLSFEVLDREGNPIKSRATTSYQLPYLITCEAPIEDIGSIRALAPDRFARLLIPLPDLPQLPPENDHLDDLFDMKISQLRIEWKGQEDEAVSQLTQLQPRRHADRPRGASPTAGLAPHDTDTSPREILERLRLDYPAGTPIRTDAKEATLTIGRSGAPTWWSRTKDWFRDLLP